MLIKLVQFRRLAYIHYGVVINLLRYLSRQVSVDTKTLKLKVSIEMEEVYE
jgi:hypothetical protein